MSRFWPDAPLYGEQRPDTLWDALDSRNYDRVLGACREEVHTQIGIIRDDGETDDGEMHVRQRVFDVARLITPETDMVAFLDSFYDCLAPLFLGAERGAQNVEAAAAEHRERIIEEISRWPYWLVAQKNYEDYPRILGLTVNKVKNTSSVSPRRRRAAFPNLPHSSNERTRVLSHQTGLRD